jgi:hypothetical protein
MKIEYFHASKYGNGAMVAQEFKTIMSVENDMVNVQHIRDAHPKAMPPADLYVFSSPGRMGKPIGGMRRFLKNVRLPAGAEYAILTTEAAPKPDKKTGKMPTPEEIAKWQRVRPIMNELLAPKNLEKVAESCVFVTRLKGPLEEGWQKEVKDFASLVSSASWRSTSSRLLWLKDRGSLNTSGAVRGSSSPDRQERALPVLKDR